MLKAFANGALFGEQYGDEPPRVLALHGWARTHVDFARVVEGIDAVALDLPGFGATPAPTSALNAREMAEAVAPILSEFPSGAVVAGHSLGGRVALQLALMHPDVVRAIVLIGTPLLRNPNAVKRKSPFEYRVAKLLKRVGVISDAKIEKLKKKYGSVDYRRADGVMRDMLVRMVNETYEDEISNVKVPAYLVWAKDDAETPIAIAEKAAPMFIQASLNVCETGGHLLLTNNPQFVRDAIAKAVTI